MPAPTDHKLLSVWIVDDLASDFVYARVMLGRAGGYGEIVRMRSAKEFITRLTSSEERPDLVFLDINMPGMNGFEALQHLQTLSCPVPPICMLTSTSRPDDRERAFSFSSVQKFVTKPITPALARDVLETLAA